MLAFPEMEKQVLNPGVPFPVKTVAECSGQLKALGLRLMKIQTPLLPETVKASLSLLPLM
jgi:hypothetical protein